MALAMRTRRSDSKLLRLRAGVPLRDNFCRTMARVVSRFELRVWAARGYWLDGGLRLRSASRRAYGRHTFGVCSRAVLPCNGAAGVLGGIHEQIMAISVERAMWDLRAQLQNAAARGADADIRYVPKSVEVELSIEISKEAETKETGALQSIVSLQGPGRPDSQNSHTVN
jgi:hypothetical protein